MIKLSTTSRAFLYSADVMETVLPSDVNISVKNDDYLILCFQRNFELPMQRIK